MEEIKEDAKEKIDSSPESMIMSPESYSSS